MPFNFKTSILPTQDNIFSLGSASQRWKINDSTMPTFDTIYPIGAVYISTIQCNPSTLFGGTWEQIEDTFLLCAGSVYSGGTTGGSATVTLETSNLPSHSHSVGAHAHSLNGHTHSGPSHSHGLNNHTHGVGGYGVASKSITGQVGQVLVPSSDLGYTSSTLYFIKKDDVTYPSSASEGGRRRVIGLNVTHNHSLSGSSGGNSGSTAANGTGATGGPSTTNTGNSSVFDSGATGSGTAHNNMPPYLTVYVYQRIA